MAEMSEGGIKQLKEIGYFRVTGRSLEGYEKYCHFEGKGIAEGSVVVDIGSGWNQELSLGLEKLENGIKTINLDASLAIPPEGVEEVSYQTWYEDKLIYVNEKMQKERLVLTRENSIAAVMPEIPLKNDVADLILDCFGPATYLEDEKWVEYIMEIERVLKKGAEAHLYPIDGFEDFFLNGGEAIEESGNRRLNLLNDKKYHLEKYLQDDSKGNMRMGMVIKKGI